MLLLGYILVTCHKNNIVTLHVTFMLYRRNKTFLLGKSCGSSLMPGNFWKLKSSPKALLYHANVPEINQVSDYDLLNFVQWNSMTIKIF